MTSEERLDYLESQLKEILRQAVLGEAELKTLNQRTDASLISKVSERRFRKAGYMVKACLRVFQEEQSESDCKGAV